MFLDPVEKVKKIGPCSKRSEEKFVSLRFCVFEK